MPQFLEMTGLSTSTIYRWMTDGTFPKQIQLGSRSVVWNERDVIDWMNAQNANT
ncbi:helix-turn-helix transcriptional regulator [Parasynechococcus marenigrum]|nr:AlpA family phage regulatory protein [Parasynechococcus marenigrum]